MDFTPQVRPERRGLSPIAIAAIAAVVFAGVLGGALLIANTFFGSTDHGSAVEGQLRGTFPTRPEVGWRLAADQAIEGAAFVRPDPSSNQYQRPGFIDLGQTLITTAVAGQSDREASLVAIDAQTGAIRWRTPLAPQNSLPAANCASKTIDGLLPCVVSNKTVQFFDIADGSVKHIRAVPAEHTYVVEVHGSAVYTMGYQTMTRGTVTDLTAGWQRSYTVDPTCPGSGDSSYFGVADASVYYGSDGGVVVASTDDGHRLIDSEVRNLRVFPGQGFAAEICTDPSSTRLIVVDETGRVVHSEPGHGPPAKPWLVAPTADLPFVSRDSAYRFGSGDRLWSAPGSELHAIVGDTVLGTLDAPHESGRFPLTAHDLATGEELWTYSETSAYGVSYLEYLSDGQRVIVGHADGGIAAVDLATGQSEWLLAGVTIDRVAPAGAGFAAYSSDHITYYPPTGGPSVAPGRQRAERPGRGSGGGPITKCGRMPEMRPVQYRAESGALVVTMEIKASCPGGDIIATDRLRIRIRDPKGLIAEGVFDFSDDPLVLGGADAPPTRIDVKFTDRGVIRHPNTVGDRSGGSSEVVTTANADGTEVVDCDDEGTSTGPTSTTGAPGRPRSPTASGTDACGSDATALDALRTQVDADRRTVQRDLADRWVAQLSSKQPGLVAPDVDGRVVTWTPCEILHQHLRLRLQYPEVRLVWSDEWRTFDLRGWWVTIAGVTFGDPDAANGWCDQRAIPVDECYAKIVSDSRDSRETTKYRR